jgi:hypothetical protein
MWVPDVYQGAPTAVTLVLAAAPKLAVFAIVVRMLVVGFGELAVHWQPMLLILGVLSLAIGNLTAIMQTNFKRMLAYSTISHMGFVILGLASGSLDGDIQANTSAYGSALTSASGNVSLQAAYNGGKTIQTAAGFPVEITSNDVANGTTGEIIRGSLRLNGGVNQLGGLFNEIGDQTFVIGKETDKPKETWTGVSAVKTHLSHAGSAKMEKTAAQVVTGPTGTIITDSAVALSDNYAYRIKINATARRSDGTFGVASFTTEGTFYRSGGGALAAGSPMATINGADGDGINYAIAFGLSGNNVVAVVYGGAGVTTPVQWALTIEYQAVGVA